MNKSPLTFAKLAAVLERHHTIAQRELNTFAAKVLEGSKNGNMSYVLSWSQDAFKWAPEAELAAYFMKYVGKQSKDPSVAVADVLDVLLGDLDSRIASKSRHPEFSSSVTSNLLNQYSLAAAANLRETLGYLVETK